MLDPTFKSDPRLQIKGAVSRIELGIAVQIQNIEKGITAAWRSPKWGRNSK